MNCRKLAVQANAADCDGRSAGSALRVQPARFRSERRTPAPRNGGSSSGKCPPPRRKRLRKLAQRFQGSAPGRRGVILLFPFEEAEDDREAFTDRRAHGLNQFNGKARAVGQAATVFVGTLVAAFPEELVNQ